MSEDPWENAYEFLNRVDVLFGIVYVFMCVNLIILGVAGTIWALKWALRICLG